jgi:hypothetical protein
MNRPNQNRTTIEATLDDLYSNELNVELSWNPKGGFHAVLGNPPLAKKTFPASGKAVRWPKKQALRHFPRAGIGSGSADADDREAILDHLCAVV